MLLLCYYYFFTFHKRRLANWLIAIAKIDCYHSISLPNGTGIHCALMFFNARVKIRLKIEFTHALWNEQMDSLINNGTVTIVHAQLKLNP